MGGGRGGIYQSYWSRAKALPAGMLDHRALGHGFAPGLGPSSQTAHQSRTTGSQAEEIVLTVSDDIISKGKDFMYSFHSPFSSYGEGVTRSCKAPRRYCNSCSSNPVIDTSIRHIQATKREPRSASSRSNIDSSKLQRDHNILPVYNHYTSPNRRRLASKVIYSQF